MTYRYLKFITSWIKDNTPSFLPKTENIQGVDVTESDRCQSHIDI